ncbi:MAG TPA: aldehyde dehydrogenase family protein [Actinomycetes bacterium]|nr:aldehyde dehydrogenase family protein [Actinomycetes bacterium]
MSDSHRITLPSEGVTPVPLAGAAATGSQSTRVSSPFDGSSLGDVPLLGEAEVDTAVAAAKSALRDQPLHPWQRAEILDKAATLLRERQRQFAEIIAHEAAKPIKTAMVEADRAVGTFTFAAAEARKLAGEVIPIAAAPGADTKIAYTMRVPIGVVGAISPFNFPLNLVAHKLAPAIAAGCPVVLKPAGQTPFSAIALAWMLVEECGLPAGYLSVVTGPGSVVGNALVDHPDVALITFTGSPAVGWGIKQRAPRKHVGLELGNNAPVVIAEDGDWRKAADKIKVAGFSHAGQSCISTQRILVHRQVADEFTEYLASLVSTLTVGDPMDESTDVSALISTGERDRVKSWVDEAVSQGGRIVTGGEIDANGVLEPTVIADAKPDMQVCVNEVFGPVVAIQTIDSVDEGLKLANDTAYGLQAAIFTKDLSTAFEAVSTLDFGGVLVNEVPTWRADQMPYGGIRDSGNTREGPAYSVREMTETRLVVIDTAR